MVLVISACLLPPAADEQVFVAGEYAVL
jgi:hypothetical protein